MRTRHASAGAKTPIEKYIDGKISSSDYFREVRRETVREVDRDLERSATNGDGDKSQGDSGDDED